ncbi:MAG TPA: OmpH family outer membrane protein [Ohtaekwangia sp.]|nr:OmpH family outer membrane protein [Ohtaekwangia sp.]
MASRCNKLILISITLALFILIGINAYLFYFRTGPKIGYVRSSELINQYAGTVEARAKFERKKSAMLANVDSLKLHLSQAQYKLRNFSTELTREERTEKENELSQLQQQFFQYDAAIGKKIDEEDKVMMTAVLNQVNSYIESYAQDQGYDIIMGTTLSGSLLYGDKALDVTDEILGHLNTSYKRN